MSATPKEDLKESEPPVETNPTEPGEETAKDKVIFLTEEEASVPSKVKSILWIRFCYPNMLFLLLH